MTDAIESVSSTGNQVAWTLPVATPDKYDVYARWGSSNSGAANANYTITHAGGTDTVTLDQTTAYDGNWIKLGTYDLAPNAGHKVMLSDRANGQVAADAIRIVSTSGGERVARWQGSVAGAGTYQVWARWTAAPTHTFAATYRVTTPGGTDSVTVDQRSGGGQWHLLKTLTLAANDNWQVELSDQTPGEVVADAIAITPPISLADTFEWAPSLPAAGDYAVYAKWQAEPGRASDATYEIAHDGGVAQVTVDQTHNGGAWRYLGSWSFDPANSPKVTLLGSLTGTLSADAIRFVAGDAIGGDIAYTHADQLGTIQKMTDASGSLAWDRTQRPFGETVAISAASGVANQLRFPGQYADETGLSYNFFRDYDPTLGRYAQSDPIGLRGGVNTYAYVGGNPLGRVDPRGLRVIDFSLCRIFPSLCVASPEMPSGDPETNDDGFVDDDDDDDLGQCDPADCATWLALLKAAYNQIVLQESSLPPEDFLILMNEHDQSVELFCALCPEECSQAPTFGSGKTIQ